MKINPRLLFSFAGAFAAVLWAASPAQAQITGINAASSFVTNYFNDSLSLNGGNPGAVHFNGAKPWSGGAVSLTQTDPTTLDYANDSISASGAGNVYTFNINNLTLTQPPGNTGHADLIYLVKVDFQLGAGGLPSQATLFPNFLASGTVQNIGSGFASVSGYLNYYSVDTFGVATAIDTVNYNWTYSTPGPFSNLPVNGTPVGGTTPALGPNTVLMIYGQFDFRVDPASLSLVTVPPPLPDPSIVCPARISDTEFSFGVVGTNGANYTVEYCTDLVLTNWTTLTSFQLTTNPFPVLDTDATNAPRYYRVRKD